jgi:predicted nucleic acid-binding protein
MSESRVCADASFLIKLVLPEDGSDRAKDLWDEWGENAVSVLAPTLILYEFTSSVNKYVQRRWLSPDRGHQALAFLLRLPLELVAGDALHQAAFTIATEAAMGSAYDAHYIAVARDLNCALWTGDRRMHGTAVKLGINATLISAANKP